MIITSRQNPLIKDIAKLVASTRLRRERGMFLAEGIHLVREALVSDLNIERILCVDGMAEHEEAGPLIKLARECNVKVTVMTAECYQRFSALRSPDGIAVLAYSPVFEPKMIFTLQGRVCILDGVQDPGNAGAIVRTAEAAGASGVIFTSVAVDPTHPAFVRGAMGASFRLPVMTMDVDKLLAAVRECGMRLMVTAADGAVDFRNGDYTLPMGLVIGSEGQGVGSSLTEAAVERLSIPMQGRVESLNAGVAAGILLYEAQRHW